MSWLIEQNQWTIPIFALSILIDAWAVWRVDKHVHHAKLFLILIATIVVGVSVNLIYLIEGALYNISPIGSMILIILLCGVLVDIYEEDLEE